MATLKDLADKIKSWFSAPVNYGNGVAGQAAQNSNPQVGKQIIAPLANTFQQGINSAKVVGPFTNPINQIASRLPGISNYVPQPTTPTLKDLSNVLQAGFAGAGAYLAPAALPITGAFQAGVQGLSNLASRKPITTNLAPAFGEGAKFGALLAPISAAVSASPIARTVSQPIQNVVGNKSPFISDVLSRVISGGSKAGVEGAAYGALTGQNPITTGIDFAKYGAASSLLPEGTRVKADQQNFSLSKSLQDRLIEAEAMLKNPTRYVDENLGHFKDPIARDNAIKQASADALQMINELAAQYLPDKQLASANSPEKMIKALVDLSKKNRLGDVPGMGLVSNNQSIPSGTKERGFVTSVKESPNVANPTQEQVAGSYIPKSDKNLMGEAQALLTNGAKIDFKNVKNIDQKIAAAIQEAVNLDKAGNHDAAAALYNNLSESGTELGRGVHAFSLLDRMSPEAIALSAAGKIKSYNATHGTKIPELTGEQTQMISDAVSKLDGLKNGSREKNIALNNIQNLISSFIPSSITDKAITVWKAGLLTSLRTHERNLVGNSIMNAFEVAKDPIATLADKVMALKTGQRTQTTTLSGLGQAVSKDTFQQMGDIVKLGFDPTETITKFDAKKINWGNNPVEQSLKAYTEAVFRTLGVADKPFWNASFARSLYDQAGAEAMNAGKQGDRVFIENLVKNPTEKMLTTATSDANFATFHDKNKISGLASAIKQWAGQKWYTKLPAEVLAPFTGVPSSIVGKTASYSPIGLAKGAMDFGRVLVGQVPELQRQAAQEIGRGVLGTGLFGLGAYLMSRGLMTGQPKDAKEAQLWQLQNKPSNSVLIGNKWVNIGSIGPQNLVLLAGAKYQEEMGKPDGSLGAYGANLAKDQLSQTFLAGVQGPLNAISDPARYGQSYVGNQVSTVIPNIVKDAAKAGDQTSRETNTTIDYLKNGIPWLRNTLLPKRDVLGNPVPQEPTGIAAFIDLFNTKTPVDNAVVNELARLAKEGSDATPSKITASQTINKQKIKLTFDQLNNLEAGVGEQLRPQLQSLIVSPEYQQLTDEQKAKAIDKLVTTVRSDYKSQNAEAVTGGQISSVIPTTSKTKIKAKKAGKLNLAKVSVKPFKVKTTKTKLYKVPKSPTFKISTKKSPSLTIGSLPKYKPTKISLRLTKKPKLSKIG